MDTKPVGFAAIGALAGVIGSNMLSSKAGPVQVDLFDDTQVNSAAFRDWREHALRACDAIRSVVDGAERVHAARGMTATLLERGHYVLARGTTAGSVSVDVRVVDADGGAK